MGFSERITGIQSSAIRRMYEKAGKSSINLSIGMPYCFTPDNIKQAAIDSINNNKTFYTSNYGLPELRKLIAERYREPDNNYDESNVMVTIGVTEAIFLILFSLAEPGSEIILSDPGYPGYNISAAMNGFSIKHYPLYFEDKFSVRAGDVIKLITPNTKAIVLNSPGNPTGGINSIEELRKIVDYINGKDIFIISDEVYRTLNYSNNEIASFSGLLKPEKLFVLDGVSKEFGMTGWRIGWIVSDSKNIATLIKAHQVMVSCAPAMSQYAAIEALTKNNKEVIQAMSYNKNLMSELLDGIPNVKYFVPDGGLYYFADFSSYGDDETLALKILENTDVITVPGSGFGEMGRGFLRLSFGAHPEDIRTGVERIKNYLLNFRD